MAVSAKVAAVVDVRKEREGLQEVVVESDGRREPALNYVTLTGSLKVGDRVVINTTAVELGLGTGGMHFVMARLAEGEPLPPGHIMKLRYTPWQFSCLAAEEQDSPHHQAVASLRSLNGMPVIACCLHSMIAPAAAGFKAERAGRVVYIMTDGAALPLALSDLVVDLRRAGLLDATITAGQAFGGDYEAVNLHSALIVAKAVAAADVAIVSQGPGNVGTGTPFGFSGIEQGEIVNAAAALGGRPIAYPRISFTERRERHRGLSHHTVTALGVAALATAEVVLPEMAADRMKPIMDALEAAKISGKHRVIVRDGSRGMDELRRRNIQVKSMGRAPGDDPEFFLAAAAAGAYAAEILG